jgi:hypothetical protein
MLQGTSSTTTTTIIIILIKDLLGWCGILKSHSQVTKMILNWLTILAMEKQFRDLTNTSAQQFCKF